ncbi:glycoside hydrolase family 19 protein [Agrobacterium rosae]|uniref:glycoside hydrolase family 19 protein n=1 Tax=Agrobacterium rosae TaxID=1972867 RepID=UPI002033C3D9|nr:glycoside hydrolase family 19 protein [Agrobacterium rosae]MCM2434119.1 hypothetical protein [Agrobacterium rosae]
MDTTTFFAYARRAPFGGRLSQGQIDGVNIIFEQWNYFKIADRRLLAYALASVFHETGGRMLPVRESFAKSDKAAITALEKAWKAGQLGSVKTPYWRKDKNGKSWFGRGDIQITHEINYAKLGKRLGVDLVGNPSLALDPVISAKIAIVGMLEGLFTGKRLVDYFSATKDDPVGARAVVNGKDKAKLIAGYHKNFLDALDAAYAAKYDQARPDDVIVADAKADNVPVAQSNSIKAIIGTAVAGGGLGVAKDVADGGASLLGAISNPWAFGSLVFTLIAVGILVWLLTSGRITINRTRAA